MSLRTDLEQILAGDGWQVRDKLAQFVAGLDEEEYKQRTPAQNNSLWLLFQKVADALVERGVTMRTIFEKTEHFDITPTKNSVHDLWIYFQKSMYGTEHTRDLHKQEEIENVHKVLMKNLGELFEVDYIDFPSNAIDPVPLKNGN